MNQEQKDDYHQTNDVPNKAILQDLIDNSGDEVTAQILKSYKIGASDVDINKEFSKWRVGPLRDTATYLRVETEGKVKPDVVNSIIARIDALLMEFCAVCSEYYHNTLEETPVYTCLICQQGCHQPCYQDVFNALQELDPKYHKSMQFICSSCQQGYHPHEKTDKANPPTKAKKSPTKPPPNPEEPHNQEPNGEEDKAADKNKETPEMTEICPQYKWNKCPNFATCEYKHPPRCRDLLRDGKCPYKKKCKYHHPPLCKYSLKERKCLNQECKFFHLAKTLRKETQEQPPAPELPANNQQNTPQMPHHQTNNNPQKPCISQTPSTNLSVDQPKSADQNQNFIPFLLMMKQLKEELLGHLGKEIADLRKSLIPSRPPEITQNVVQPPSMTLPSSQQLLLNQLVQGMSTKSQ